MFQRLYKRYGYAVSGILYAVRKDKSYRGQFYFGGLLLTVVIYLFSPLSHTEAMFAVLSWVLVLITELQNSAFEAALDRLHPEIHDTSAEVRIWRLVPFSPQDYLQPSYSERSCTVTG